ncbi:DUF1419 domain-containing protein [Mesorhizobium sp. M7A.F.Ca.MR.362.00.0.0]|uniref:DUF1419 domain-containing protein n=1 Tax=Mesorhizobium sp. M7A.F.Ca.MR.362.00.0.0 TaxID=2496779 RepID=UPI000FD52F86|nr:DUF1419 domain-containing protein [Mesorhizobium sp. M7A.F.Ca.MR.362.00.0.0]RUU78231.1 DUF1419 domain-containing protein [Mesorhizobium sp. M7A.F.Ca.MR.362.00.0.0]RWN95421.1 MAG: DUF1419 domain-containing protein [Mesorhizobium sp.]
MLQLPSALDDRTLHFVNLNRWTREGKPAQWMLGKFWQIDQNIYDEFLNMLPPIYCVGGFRLCERLTDDIASTFLTVGPRLWCAFTNLTDTRPEKMISHIARETQS